MKKLTMILIASAVMLSSCANPSKNQLAAEMAGLAAFDVASNAYANGQKLDGKVAIKAVAAAKTAAMDVLSAPSSTPVANVPASP